MQTRTRRGSSGSVIKSDEISFDRSSENMDESESDLSDDGVKSGANSVQPSPMKGFSFRNKPAPSTDSRLAVSSPNKDRDQPLARRTRRNSIMSEDSGITDDKKNKSATPKSTKPKQNPKEVDHSDDDESSDEDEKKPSNDKKDKKERNDREKKDQDDQSDSDVSGPDDSEESSSSEEQSESGYESESESGEVRKKKPAQSNNRNQHNNRRGDNNRNDDGRKHYPKRERRKSGVYEYGPLRQTERLSFRRPETAVLTRSQLKALDKIGARRSQPNRNSSTKTPSSVKTQVSPSRRESLRERHPAPTPRTNSLKKLDEMLSDSVSSDESDFGDDDTSTIRRSKRVRKEVDRFQPSPNKKEREQERRRAREAARAQGKPYKYNSDGSSTYSSDEYQEFREKAVLTLKPINTKPRDQIAVGPNRNTTIGDITPMDIDKSVNWGSVGGLDHHVKALKEMVLFPLLYPEIFQRFQITPPKGVLFYGPPGTGKTLVARALANTCSSSSGQKISFFMRKGADILSKWVGEAERQLRLLFDEARRLQPSIVFFDEIDGLAPVRSSKQDQIHSSIVSTLLALMDGLDNRGQVIVIGATNRIDAIDPALRRPGRFDREFLFTLPSKVARREIISIHTQKWYPPIEPQLRDDIADHCVGYCGADLKALCSEAVLNALRRNYPQIYEREQKLLLDPSKIIVSSHDFIKAMKSITPASHRSVSIHARPLLRELRPLLQEKFNALLDEAKKMFPFGSSVEQLDKEFEIVDPSRVSKTSDIDQEVNKLALETELYDLEKRYTTQQVFRPRILICGKAGNGQSHLGAALLHHLEEFPVFSADLSTLHADLFSRSLEEAFVTRFNEAIKKLPAVLFIPHLDSWWKLATPALQETFLTSMKDLDPTLPLLLMLTIDDTVHELPSILRQVFATDCAVIEVKNPPAFDREPFFEDIFKLIMKPALRKRKRRKMKELPLAPPPAPREPTPEEREAQHQADEHYLRLLRMEIRDILDKIRGQRKYQSFFKPMSLEMYPDYYEVVKEPMDLLTIQRRNDENYYITFDMFLEDLNLVMSNVGLYFNEHNDHSHLLSKVRAMKDLISALFVEVSKETVINCIEIAKSGRVVPGKKVPPQLPPKPMPIDLVNDSHAEQQAREVVEDHRRHSARLKGETIAEEVLHSFAEAAIRERKALKRKEAREALSKDHHEEDEHSHSDDESGQDEQSHSRTAKDKTNKDNEEKSGKDNEENHKEKSGDVLRRRVLAGRKSVKLLKRKRDEGEEQEENWLQKKRPRTDSNLSKNSNKSLSNKKSTNTAKDSEKEEKSTLDLSIEEVVEERSVSLAKDSVALENNNNNNNNSHYNNDHHEKITFDIDPDLLPVNNTNADNNNTNENGTTEQMQIEVEEESESEEEPIQPVEISQKKLNKFRKYLIEWTECMTVDQLHSVFIALQNCAFEERFNHQRNGLIKKMREMVRYMSDQIQHASNIANSFGY